MDWNEVIPAAELDYIMGNPPFVGARVMSPGQKDDLISVFGAKWKNIGNMDYVTGFRDGTCQLLSCPPLPMNVRYARQIEQVWKNYTFSKIRTEALRSGGIR